MAATDAPTGGETTSPPVEHDEQPARGTHREGWFRAPSGHPVHADGPSQYRALTDRGFTAITEDEAKAIVADGATLEADGSREGNFDADAVAKAVKEESTRSTRRRRT